MVPPLNFGKKPLTTWGRGYEVYRQVWWENWGKIWLSRCSQMRQQPVRIWWCLVRQELCFCCKVLFKDKFSYLFVFKGSSRFLPSLDLGWQFYKSCNHWFHLVLFWWFATLPTICIHPACCPPTPFQQKITRKSDANPGRSVPHAIRWSSWEPQREKPPTDAMQPATNKAPFQTFVQLRVAWEEDEGPDPQGKLNKNSHSRWLFFFGGGMVKW